MRCRGCNKKLGQVNKANPLAVVTYCPNLTPEQWHLKCLAAHHAGANLADAVIENWGSGRGTGTELAKVWEPRAVTVDDFGNEEL
jgi:hypothetical protein